jgi:hypothetical protein
MPRRDGDLRDIKAAGQTDGHRPADIPGSDDRYIHD